MSQSSNTSAPREGPRDGQRIAKLLARAGIASRREIERMIEEGRVALNDVVIDTPATVLTSLAGVTVDGDPVEAPAAARLFLYHKPAGLLVTERDPGGRPTIYDKLPDDLPRLVPVGRLDINTEGLLLMTTDGELKRQLELPATGVERAYRARAYGNITQAQLEELIHGIEIEGVRYGSINANLERRTGANVWIEMILTEGKNREVRRVLEFLGLKVSRLIRTRYGPFLLADLPVGGIGEVKGHDVAAFRKNPTKNPPPERLRRDEKFSERPRNLPVPTPVQANTARPRPDGPRPAPGSPSAARKPSPVQAGKPATRITREAASAADRAAFIDSPTRGQRASGRPARPEPKPTAKSDGWQPPTEHQAREPIAGAKPKRFYDAKPPRDRAATPARDGQPARPARDGQPARPARVFNAELGRNVRAKAPGAPRAAGDAARPSRPSTRPTPKSGPRPTGGNTPRGAPPRNRK
ncbi:pseudouridine synthase [Sphingomonas sp. PB4P5]|uniref:pseudouridine synthase n=1 Tax=Parasphingomonas puruogangriensis TaxID=3096155 RepID=UPI002FCAC8D3